MARWSRKRMNLVSGANLPSVQSGLEVALSSVPGEHTGAVLSSAPETSSTSVSRHCLEVPEEELS